MSRLMFYMTLIMLMTACDNHAPQNASTQPTQKTTQNITPQEATSMPEKITKTDEQWRKELTAEQYRVLREKGTEQAFTGKYTDTTDAGIYVCAACNHPAFDSQAKYHSGCGWPAFSDAKQHSVEETQDISFGMSRTEITCAKCGSHLGHVFNDGPPPTGLRYCINSVAIKLIKRESVDGQAGHTSGQ